MRNILSLVHPSLGAIGPSRTIKERVTSIVLLVLGLALPACGARTTLEQGTDASIDVTADVADTNVTDQGIDQGIDAPVDVGPPPCGRYTRISGRTPAGPFDFPYVEASTGAWCPVLFIQVTDDSPERNGDSLIIRVSYDSPGPGLPLPPWEPARVTANVSHQRGDAHWSGPIEIDVIRADGLFRTGTPGNEGRITVDLSYSDEQIQIDGFVDSIDCHAIYCG